MIEADYVIVGSGSAGSALAYRLGEDARNSVAVIELGGTDFGPLIQMPSALSYPMNMRRYDWGFSSEPEPGLGGRRLATPRGKVVGGSSSINGMVYVRGHALDFDHWEETGAKGWAFRHVLPYFKRMEALEGGDPGWRGVSGPLRVSRARMANPLYRAFIEAGRAAGYRVTPDYNGAQQEGFGAFEQTIWKGERFSTAKAYLRPALKRGNTRLVQGLATGVVFDGRRATGVEVANGQGKPMLVRARREVVLAASAINSPKLLMLSGIGPAQHLREQGIATIANRPGVGSNLQDHLEIYIQAECLQPITLNGRLGLLSKAGIGAEWLFFKRGLGATNHFESCGFIRSRAGEQYPDIQYHFLPAAIRYDGRKAIAGHGFQVHVGPMRSKSRGTVRLRAADPAAPPVIRFNYMSHPDDWTDFRTAITLTREVFAQEPMRPYLGREIQPGAGATSGKALDEFVRDHAESAYHPCGTCKIGAPDDPLAVVDPECRVIGVDGLRVADSSIFPRITNGNLNAPSIMTGEKAADHILGRDPLPSSNQEPWVHPEWQTKQR